MVFNARVIMIDRKFNMIECHVVLVNANHVARQFLKDKTFDMLYLGVGWEYYVEWLE